MSLDKVWDYIGRNDDQPDEWTSEGFTGAEFRELLELKGEIERLRALTEEQNGQLAILRGVLERQRNVIIEECAKVSEEHFKEAHHTKWACGLQIAAAIRGRKDKP